jgi:hypothetical protein
MGVSNWYLFFGGLFCCTGFGLPLGIFCFVYWFYKDFMDKGITVNHKHESTTLPIESLLGQDYREREVRINEISTKLEQKKEPELRGNIGDLKDREKYT